jgi:hypothetical protein
MKAARYSSCALLLAACSATGEQEMETCRKEALRITQTELHSSAMTLDDRVKACMAARGFRFSALSYNCGHGDPYQDAACYSR